MSLGLWVPQACPFPGHPNMVSSEASSLLTALTSRLPLWLGEDREGPCLPIGHIPGASLWRRVTGAAPWRTRPWQSHTWETARWQQGLANPRRMPALRTGSIGSPVSPNASGASSLHPKGPSWGGALGPADVCSPIPTAVPSGWKKIQEIISFLLFLSLRLFEKYIFFHTSRKLILFMFWRRTRGRS